MDNQHKKIKGYRDLSQAEIDLMNKIKAHAEATRQLIAEVQSHVISQFDDAATMEDAAAKSTEQARMIDADPLTWAADAKKELQTGFMKLVRAVAQPTSF